MGRRKLPKAEFKAGLIPGNSRSAEPSMLAPGPKNSICDVQALKVGNASDSKLRSGATVLVADHPFTAAVHIMGGAPGTRETELLAPDKLVQQADAIVIAGGSAFGLDAASGVADRLAETGRGFAVGEVRVPIVPSAILFDLLNGGEKSWTVNPYRKLGKLAFDQAGYDFEIGSVGAGTGAVTMDLKGGLGTASAILSDGSSVGALVAVNATGSAVQNGGPNFWSAPYEMNGEFGGLGPGESNPGFEPPTPILGPKNATTIAIVATDVNLTQAQAKRLAVSAHDGIARSIVPAHTIFDGDVVFAVSTGQYSQGEGKADLFGIGHAAATCLSRAVARAVYAASSWIGDTVPDWRSLHAGMNS